MPKLCLRWEWKISWSVLKAVETAARAYDGSEKSMQRTLHCTQACKQTDGYSVIVRHTIFVCFRKSGKIKRCKNHVETSSRWCATRWSTTKWWWACHTTRIWSTSGWQNPVPEQYHTYKHDWLSVPSATPVWACKYWPVSPLCRCCGCTPTGQAGGARV